MKMLIAVVCSLLLATCTYGKPKRYYPPNKIKRPVVVQRPIVVQRPVVYRQVPRINYFDPFMIYRRQTCTNRFYWWRQPIYIPVPVPVYRNYPVYVPVPVYRNY